MKRLWIALVCAAVLCWLCGSAMANGGVIVVTLKSGLDGVADIVIDSSISFGLHVTSEEDFVNGTFTQEMIGDTLYTEYKVSDAPESFGRTDLLCWKITYLEQGYSLIVYPGQIITDSGNNANFTLEAIWDGLERNSYAFSTPQSVIVTENTINTTIPFTLSELALGSADSVSVWMRPGEFSDGENTIHYSPGIAAGFTEAGQTKDCSILISEDEWAKAKAGDYTAMLEYDVKFLISSLGNLSPPIRTLHGSVPMTLQVGHNVTVSSNHPYQGTASASTAMAREGEIVTLTATPAYENTYGLRSWSVQSGGVTVNADNTFVMGHEDVSITALFDMQFEARFWNDDETLLYADRVFEGETPVYAGATPAMPSSERYDYFFTGWDPTPGPLTSDGIYYAQFREEAKNLVTFTANGGSGTMASDSYYVSEGTYTLPSCSFTAPEGHVFRDWTVSWRNELGGTSTFDYMAGSNLTGLTDDLTVTANWLELSLRASPAVAGGAEYANGAFTATANPGYTFDHWEYAMDEYGTAPIGTVWPTANPYKPLEVDYKFYTAVFTANPYALTIPDNIRNGTVVQYSGTPKTGNTIKLTVTPDEGYRLASLSYTPHGGTPVPITEIDNNGRYFFAMPAGDVTVTAKFVSASASEPTFGPAAFTLPANLATIGESAFEGMTAMTVVDAGHVTAIGANAFRGCTALTQLRLPAACTIDATAFTSCDTVFIFAPAGGTTEASCLQIANVIFVPVD